MLHVTFWLAERMPWLKWYIRKQAKEVERLLPLDAYGLEQYTAEECLKDLRAFLIVLMAAGVLAGGTNGIRYEYLLAGILAAGVTARYRFDSWRLRQEKRLLIQLSEYLDELRYAYYRSHDAEDALYEAWMTAGEEWKLHLAVMEENIFDGEIPIIYQREHTQRYFMSFLAICQCAVRYGGENGEETTFLDNLEELQGNVQMELLKRDREKELFLAVLPGILIPILCLPVMERWSVAQIPELTAFYDGRTGGMVRVLICVVFWLIWRVFRFLRMGESAETVYKTYLPSKLRDWLDSFLVAWNRLEGEFGRWIGDIYRTVYPVGRLRDFYVIRLRYMWMTAVLETAWFLIYRIPPKYVLFGIPIVILGSFLPYLELVLAGDFYLNAREEEVSQFRSVLYLLSGVPQMTAEVVLEWLERFSYYFRGEITACLDEQMIRVDETDQTGFRRILEDVEAADRVGIKEAFRDIVAKREFWRAKRRQEQELAARKKEVYIQVILFLPFGTAVAAYLILPFLYEGMRGLMSFMEMGV